MKFFYFYFGAKCLVSYVRTQRGSFHVILEGHSQRCLAWPTFNFGFS